MNISKKKMNNKGAVEMSLNLIIMLVIGLTVMGLIIAFVTNFLGDATGNFQQQLDEQDTNKLEEVMARSENLAFLSTSLTTKRGSVEDVYMKLENPLSDALSSDQIFDEGNGVIPQSSGTENFYYEISGQQVTGGNVAEITVTGPPMQLDSVESDSYKLDVEVADNAQTGIYYLNFNWEVPGATRNYSEVITLTVE